VITGEIFVGYFEEDFRENIDHYNFICSYQLSNKHFEMKFEIHFEFRASLRKFQDLNFWDATTMVQPQLKMRNRYLKTIAWIKGEHKNKKTKRRKKYQRHLQPKSAPTFKRIIRWIKSLVTSARELLRIHILLIFVNTTPLFILLSL
jgi:hypothetical protein